MGRWRNKGQWLRISVSCHMDTWHAHSQRHSSHHLFWQFRDLKRTTAFSTFAWPLSSIHWVYRKMRERPLRERFKEPKEDKIRLLGMKSSLRFPNLLSTTLTFFPLIMGSVLMTIPFLLTEIYMVKIHPPPQSSRPPAGLGFWKYFNVFIDPFLLGSRWQYDDYKKSCLEHVT